MVNYDSAAIEVWRPHLGTWKELSLSRISYVARRRSVALGLSVAEAAEAIGISPSTLYRLWGEDCGPPRTRIGSRWVVPARELMEWLGRKEEPSNDR